MQVPVQLHTHSTRQVLVGAGVLLALSIAAYAVTNSSSTAAASDSAYTDMSPEAFRNVTADPATFTVDVHVPEQDHIPGTNAFIPYNRVAEYRHLLPEDKTAPIAVYCRTDTMSRQVVHILTNLGYENIYHLDGGTQAWREAGLPVEDAPFDEPGIRE